MSAPYSRARRMAATVSSSRSANDAEVRGFGAFRARQRREREGVGADDLAGPRLDAGRHQLVAGGEHGDFRPPVHGNERMVHGGGKRKIARREPMAGGEECVARCEVQSLRADVAALGGRPLHLDAIALPLGEFLDHHRVGAVRHHPAGENARRLAATHRARKRPAGGDLADDL